MVTITQLSSRFDISPRTLRYYEQLGLIASTRLPDYAYRTYDEHNTARVAQIVLLRKLRIPIKQIAALLKSDDAVQAIEVFEQHAQCISGEIDALDTLRSILRALIERLSSIQTLRFNEHLLTDDTIRALIQSAPEDSSKIKEVKTVQELNQAEQQLNKLKDVRIVYLPPATVAASHFIGDCPEDVTGDQIFKFATERRLWEVKPDLRMYGFNHPNPVDETGFHGYEFWLTIPDDMDVPAPLTKKHFPGGLYAAHMIKMGDFHEWVWLDEWVRNNGEYVYRGGGRHENMFDSLEEHLNIYTHYASGESGPPDMQLDLLIPVRRK